jgi:hypothetical protein
MGTAGSMNGKKTNAYRVLVEKPEGKRPLRRPRHGSENNVKMDLREIGWDGMYWIDLTQDTDQWRALVNFRVSSNFLKILEKLSNWRVLKQDSNPWS